MVRAARRKVSNGFGIIGCRSLRAADLTPGACSVDRADWRPPRGEEVARKLSFRLLNESAEATARNTSMLGLILFGVYMLAVLILLLFPSLALVLVPR